jgi:hypothetical protein
MHCMEMDGMYFHANLFASFYSLSKDVLFG